MDLLAQANRGGDGLIACFPFILLVVVVIVIVLISMGASASHRQTLAHVAIQLGGRVERADLFQGFSTVHFEHGGQPATLRFSRVGQNQYYTHLEFQWSGPPLRCEVYPEGILAGLRKLMGMHDIAIGSPQFDDAFVITGDDEAGIRSLLSGDVQTAVVNLSNYASGLHLRFGSRSLTVTCKGLTREFTRLIKFVSLCRELCDAAVVAQGHGIEFVDGAPLTLAAGAMGDARCMVCGEVLAADVVHCRRCKTPHHRDCWSYGGGCSTYGCGEKRFAAKN